MIPSLRFLSHNISLQVIPLLFLLSLASTMQAQTTIRYVKPAASGNGSGSSWTNASGNLQAMIEASSSDQQVWVATGNYRPAANSSFALKNGVAIYGGFRGTESSLSQRPTINPITLQPSSTTLSGNGKSVINNNDPYGLDRTALLDGFVITGGNATYGGGMYNFYSSPTITNCSFQTNTATEGLGGGMYNRGSSSPGLTNCLFQQNTAYNGAGMYNAGSNPVLTNCSFLNNAGNVGFNYGAGMSNSSSSPVLVNCTFQNNTVSDGNGGGMYNESSSNPSLTNCSFQGNSAPNGGGMFSDGSRAILVNCIFQNNKTTGDGYGGGLYNWNGSSPSLTNCSFQSNTAFNGGGMYNYYLSNPSLTNCSFQGNTATGNGGGMATVGGSSPVLVNCVVFGNGAANTFYNTNSSVSASYSLFEASVTGYTNSGHSLTTSRSPFSTTTSTRLNGCAAAINTGSNAAYATTNGPTTDLAGNPRFFSTSGPGAPAAIDMGAYEYQASSSISVSNPATTTATAGQPFSQTFTAGGGTSPYRYTVVDSNLPASLSLSAAGVLSGTPTVAGSYSLTVQALDASSCAGTNSAYSLSVGAPNSPIRYVKPRSSGNGSGNSWDDASGDLQSQINVPGAQQVWVTDGTYRPATNGSFALKNGVAIYGGFMGTESRLSQRPAINSVADQPSGSILQGNGSRVINNPTGLDRTALLDGFILTGGDASTNGFTGGGMYNSASSPRIANCTFRRNTAGTNGSGGGIFNADGSSPSLTNCRFEENSAFDGGGIANSSSNPVLTNCSFLENTVAGYGYGGGMYNTYSSPKLTNCSFQNNTSLLGAGGMFNGNSSSPVLINCSFERNSAAYGGGMYNADSSNPVLNNCLFQDNSVSMSSYGNDTYGGGMVNYDSSPRLTNCSFQGNTAKKGGGIYNYTGSDPVLTNCSFQGNKVVGAGGAIYNNGGLPSLTNCVVFGNGAANTFYNTDDDRSTLTASYSLFETSVTGYTNGDYNIATSTSPFVSTTSTQLNGCTPAINTGSNAAYTRAGGEKTDLAGNPRTYGSSIDMGAYEYQASPTTITITNPSVSTATVGQPFSQSFTVSGGTAPYSFSAMSSNLPASLSLSPAGVLSGTPTQSGSYRLNVQAQDANGCVDVPFKAYTLTVMDATPTLTGFAASASAVCVGSPVTFTATVGNVTDSYTYTLTNGIGTPAASFLTGTASTTAFSQNLTAAGSGSQHFTLTVSSNGQLATAATSLMVNALPISTLSAAPSATLTCAQTSLTLTADGSTDGSGSLYTFSSNVVSRSGNRAVINITGIYSLTVTNPSGCSSTSSLTIYSNTTPPTPTLTASNGGVLTCARTSLPLTAGGSGDTGATFAYAFAGPGLLSQTGNQAIVNASGLYSLTVSNPITGCFSTTTIGVSSATAIVSVTNPAQTMTALGTPFSQPFTASGGGSPYSFSLASGMRPAGLMLSTTGVLSGSATQQGSFPLTVSATDANGCTGTGLVYALSIPTTQFTVLSRDPENGNLNTNTLKPYLLLQNDGNAPIAYGELTVRYWLTVENPVPLRYDVNYAQMGNDKVHFTYVPLSPVRQGATGYIEFSFDASAGSLAPMSNAVIQDLINKQDYSIFFQGDDYSYVNNANFAPNPHITAYRNGVLIYGAEPGQVSGVGPSALTLTASASQYAILTTGSTQLQANVSGGTPGYTYAFTGPGTITPNGSTANVSGLSAGVQTFTVTVTDATQPVNQTVSILVSVTVTAPPVNQPPVATANANQTATVGVQFAYTANAFTDNTPGSLTYTASINPANGLTFNPATRVIQGIPLNTGVSSITITATNQSGLSASTVFTITVNAAPVAPTALTLTASASPTTILTTGSIQLRVSVSGGTPGYTYVFSGPGTITPNGSTATVAGLTAGVQTFTVIVADATAPVRQTITTTVSVTVTAPPANQSPVTTVNNDQTATVGVPFAYTANAFTDDTPNSLTYTASISPANGLTFSPLARTIQGIPQNMGMSSVTITATDPGGLSASTIFAITVNPAPVVTSTPLTVLSRDPDNGQLSTNTLKPYLLLQNDGGSAIPYPELTVRYWLTVENPVPLRFDINYAQMGNDNVHLQYVPLAQPRPGATGYIEFSFDASAGGLAGGSNAVIQDLINKQDYSYFNQGDDYSYVNNSDFAPNPRITAYRNGMLVYGTEPPMGGRLGAEGADAPWTVRVLGNPVRETITVLIEGAAGQAIELLLSDVSGHVVATRRVVASPSHREVFDVHNQGAGLLLLQVMSLGHSQTLKVIKE